MLNIRKTTSREINKKVALKEEQKSKSSEGKMGKSKGKIIGMLFIQRIYYGERKGSSVMISLKVFLKTYVL